MKERFSVFTARNKRVLRAWVAVLVMTSLVSFTVMGLAGCSGKAPATMPTVINKVPYSVSLLTNAGKPVENVGVFIYTDEFKTNLLTYGRTDSNGVMTFSAKEDRYTAFLDNVPAGFAVQDHYNLTEQATDIVLDVQFRQPDSGTVINPGDIMCEMRVKATDGQTYKISELLQEKRMVMLNFWSLDCPVCIEELPYLQTAYATYQDEVAVLAVNPVDTDTDAIKTLQKQLGLTFPVAAVNSKWQSIMNVQNLPTSIVIDRYGTVCMATGAAFSAEVFEHLFAYYTVDNYTQTVTQNIDEITNSAALIGTAAQPLEIMDAEEFDVTVPAGGRIYCNLYRVFDIILSLESADAKVTVDSTVVTPVDGVIATEVNSPNSFEPLLVRFDNISQQEQTFKVKLSFKEGSHSSPYPLTPGTITTTVEPGNEQGVFYLYKAEQKGVLGIACTKAPAGVIYDYALYNWTSGSYVNEVDTDNSYYIVVNPGDQVLVSISALKDAKGHTFPGGEFESLVTLEN